MQAFLKPVSDAINGVDKMDRKKEYRKFHDHLKALYESAQSASWVTMAPPMGTPFTHITAQKDATDVNLLRAQKNLKDDANKAFVKALQDLNKAMVDYSKNYFKKDGLTFNPKVCINIYILLIFLFAYFSIVFFEHFF